MNSLSKPAVSSSREGLLQLGKNSLWLTGSRVGAQGMTVLFTILLARRLGISEFGEYAWISALVFAGNVFTTFGTDMLFIREIAAKNSLDGLASMLAIQVSLSVLFVGVLWFGAGYIHPESAAVMRLYSLSLFPLAFFSVFTTALRGRQRMDLYAWLNLLIAALQIGAVLLLIFPGGGLFALMTGLLAVQVLAACFAGLVCARAFPDLLKGRRFQFADLVPVFKAAAPIAALSVLGIAYQRLNVFALAGWSGSAETGIYSAAARAVEASRTFHLAALTALYPAMSRAGSLVPDEMKGTRTFRISLQVLFGSAFLLGLGLSGLAGPLVRLLFGTEFEAAVGPLRILAWSLVPYSISSYLTLAFLAARREAVIARALTLGLAALLVLDLWLVPAFGARGAAWSMLVSECLQAGYLLWKQGGLLGVPLNGKDNELSPFS